MCATCFYLLILPPIFMLLLLNRNKNCTNIDAEIAGNSSKLIKIEIYYSDTLVYRCNKLTSKKCKS